jgi:hypothetical protein
MIMDREQFSRVFYGEGPVPPPWATDCPVKFEAWWAYARSPPGAPVDLILAVGEQQSVARVFEHISHFPAVGNELNDRRPVLSGAYIAVKLRFDELIAMVVPLTSLGRKIGSAREVVASRPTTPERTLMSIIRGDDFVVPATEPTLSSSAWETAQISYRQVERREHLRWFLRMIDAVISAWARTSRTKRATQIWQLLQNVPVTQQLLPTREAGAAPAIDRRARHPVRAVTLNRPVFTAVSESRITIKADAAEQLFGVDCSEIGWAVVDSGIDARHPAFQLRPPYSPPPPPAFASRVIASYDLTRARDGISPDTYEAIIDWAAVIPHITIAHDGTYRQPTDPHGTHVAGVLGGDWDDGPSTTLRGIAPTIRLYDFRVMGAGGGDEFQVIAALQLIRFLNEQSGTRLIHGANISLSLRHDLANYSCGWTPICEECDRLVRSGVVVVAAAGNAGFQGGDFAVGYGYNTVSITDPGNTEAVITVGSTHRSHPHRHGVSYFSSRGPTADGRNKPDLLAPGEDIDGPVPHGGLQAMHGTSQAAAHVSGAAAILMARYRELRGRPERVKQILCSAATDLDREGWFQGHGLVDVLRAMQSI